MSQTAKDRVGDLLYAHERGLYTQQEVVLELLDLLEESADVSEVWSELPSWGRHDLIRLVSKIAVSRPEDVFVMRTGRSVEQVIRGAKSLVDKLRQLGLVEECGPS